MVSDTPTSLQTMYEGSQTPPIITAIEWLTWLYGDTPRGLIWVGGSADGFKGRTFRTPAEAAMYGLQLDQAGGVGVYHRLTTMREVQSGRGRADDSLELPGFALDCDVVDPGHASTEYPADQASWEGIIAEAGVPSPDAWVSSGGGFYPYWRLRDASDMPVDVSDTAALADARARSEALQVAVRSAALARGFKLDATHDLARIYRLPGTTNRKVAGRPRPCVVRLKTDRRRRLDDPTEPLLVVTTPRAAPERHRSTETAGPMAGEREVLARVAELLAELRNAPEQSGNDTATSVAFKIGQFVGAGQLDMDQAEDACLEAIAGWTFRDAESERGMYGTIRRQLQIGARSPRPWEQSMSSLPEPELITIKVEEEVKAPEPRRPAVKFPAPGPALEDLVSTERIGTLSRDFVILSALVATSACLPNVKIAIGESPIIRPNLFGVLVGKSGSGKTPALNHVMHRLEKLDEDAWESFSEALTANEMAKKEVERANKARLKAEKVAISLGSDHISENAENGDWIRGGSIPITDPEPPDVSPKDPSILLGNVTIEALYQGLSDSEHGAKFLYSDEIATITGSWGQYKSGKGSDGAKFLELYSGATYRGLRISGATMVRNPYVCCLGGLQPKFLNELGEIERGAHPRFLAASYDEVVVDDVRSRDSALWDEFIERLYVNIGRERTWTLNPEAEAAVKEHGRRWKLVARESVDPVRSFYLKAADTMCHLSAVVAELMDLAPTPLGGTLTRKHIDLAAQVVDASLDVWMALVKPAPFSRVDEEGEKRNAALLEAAKLKDNGILAPRTIRNEGVVGTRNMDKIHDAMYVFARSYPGQVWTRTIPPSRGWGEIREVISAEPMSAAEAAAKGYLPPTVDKSKRRFVYE